MSNREGQRILQFFPYRFFAWLLKGSVVQPISRFATSVIVVAGPWLLSVVALAILSVKMEPLLGRSAMEDLRLYIIYALCIAPLVASPIGAVVAQCIRESMEKDGARLVSELFLVAATSVGIMTMAIAILVCLAFGVTNLENAVAFVFLTVSTSLLWTNFAVLSAIRANAFLMAAFASGMLTALVTAFIAAGVKPTVDMLIWSFTSGIILCVALAMSRFSWGSERDTAEIKEAAFVLVNAFKRHQYLALGIVFAFCGVWIDKWVLWLGPNVIQSESGFLHYGGYDSVMFIAHLSIIPCFAAFHILYDSELTAAIKNVRTTLARRANFRTFRASVELSLIHISEPTRRTIPSRMPSSA